jgi:hypothetical protein
VALHRFGLSVPVPLTATIAELPHEFLLFGIHRHHGLPLPLENRGPAVDVLELCISIRVMAAFERLAVGLETVAEVMEEAVDGPLTHPMPLGLESRR